MNRTERLLTLLQVLRRHRRPVSGQRLADELNISIRTIAYFTEGRILASWCEKQQNYRHFRTDSIISLTVLNIRYPRKCESLFREWHSSQMDKISHKRVSLDKNQ